MSRERKATDWCPTATVEALDPIAYTAVRRFNLPIYEGDLGWSIFETHARTPLRKATIIFVVASGDPLFPTGSDDSVRLVARRVDRYRAVGQTAIGICGGNPNKATAPANGVLRLRAGRWERDLRKALILLTSVLCESQPQVAVCTDWGDVMDLLASPGELYLEWSQLPNHEAVRTALERIRERVSGRRCTAILCRLGGGQNRWIKELKTVSGVCNAMLESNGIVLGGDSIALFRGRPGCCILVVAE